ncbi:UNVERIFIED_ORG: hypothetical protein GGE44_000243 [Rhizobium esperanzae]
MDDELAEVIAYHWGSEYGRLTVRRLVTINTVKKPIWEDGVL